MSRELRRVHPAWKHPKDNNGRYIPLLDGGVWDNYIADHLEAVEEEGSEEEAEEAGSPKPNKNNFMPVWSEEEATAYQWYESVSEGTPISPPMPSKEALAEWLSDNHTDRLSRKQFTKEQWLKVVNQGYVPTVISFPGTGVQSGTEHVAEKEANDD